MSDLVGNPNCWFSHAQAQLSYVYNIIVTLDLYLYLAHIETIHGRGGNLGSDRLVFMG